MILHILHYHTFNTKIFEGPKIMHLGQKFKGMGTGGQPIWALLADMGLACMGRRGLSAN